MSTTKPLRYGFAITILSIIAAFFYLLHQYFLQPWLELATSQNRIVEQHLLLYLITVIILSLIYFLRQKFGARLGFILLGLLLIKMMLVAGYAYAQGWLEADADYQEKAVFMFYYMGYLIALVGICFNWIQQAMAPQK